MLFRRAISTDSASSKPLDVRGRIPSHGLGPPLNEKNFLRNFTTDYIADDLPCIVKCTGDIGGVDKYLQVPSPSSEALDEISDTSIELKVRERFKLNEEFM